MTATRPVIRAIGKVFQVVSGNLRLFSRGILGFLNQSPYLSQVFKRLSKKIQKVVRAKPLPPFVFFKRYTVQLGFCLILVTFLAASVGEGQAYDIAPFDISADIDNTDSGFIGRPQIFAGQTVLTGEVQQSVAIIYKVEKGDTLSSIAKRYSLSVGSILDANNMKPLDAVKVDSQLIIPAEDSNTSLAWLDSINEEKERQRKLAEAARARQLSQATTRSRSSTRSNLGSSGGPGKYQYVGTVWGSYNGGYPGQCTWLVNDIYDFPGRMGNGGQYLANARKYGLKTSSVGDAGDVYVSSESYWGHAAVVLRVEGDYYVIKEMNYLGPGQITIRWVHKNSSFIKGFIKK